MRQRNRAWLAPAAALALVITTAGNAFATVVPPSGQVLTSSVAPSFYSYDTTVPYWSVIAENPQQPSDYDLYLYNSAGAEVGYSDYGVGYTDFVAVDSNSGTEGYQNWFATVTRYAGSGPYALQAQYGATITTIPTPTHQGTTGAGDPDLAFLSLQSPWVVNISDIYLTAGESFWATTTSAADNMYLLEANPSNSATFIQGRSQATNNQHTQVVDGCTLYTAEYTGWHALVIVSDTYPQTTNPGSGIAFGIHAYNAAQPTSCPMADWPNPTP